MAVKKYIAYKGGWGLGDPIELYIPYENTTTESSIGRVFDSLDAVIAKYPWVDKNASIFYYTEPSVAVPDYIKRYTLNGFLNIVRIELSTSSSLDLFISEKNYIHIFYEGESWKTYYYAGDTMITGYVGPYEGSFPSIPLVADPTVSYVVNFSINFYSNVPNTSCYLDTRTYASRLSDIQAYIDFWSEGTDTEPDPYEKGGNSGTGGGTGTFSGTSDSIEFPGLPTLSATSTGFITLFNPTIAEMQSLATYMWSDVFDIGLYKTLFADPMDCILGCSIVPVAVPNGGTKTVNVGNVSTGISMTVAASQYVEVDCGTLNVEEYWGSYLDYDPYTKAEIYLPYCGTHALQVDDIMGKAVHVKYHVDILSGACCAYVKCGGSVMYSFVGQCSSSIPISANDWTNVVNGALTIAASVGSLIATGGASAPMAVGAAAAVTGTIYGGGIKQNVEKSGSMGGTGGMLAVQTPYLILTRPRQALPKKQNTYTGYPSFITTKLSDLKGYTEIDSIRITGVPATDAELNELESILKSGVIF